MITIHRDSIYFKNIYIYMYDITACYNSGIHCFAFFFFFFFFFLRYLFLNRLSNSLLHFSLPFIHYIGVHLSLKTGPSINYRLTDALIKNLEYCSHRPYRHGLAPNSKDRIYLQMNKRFAQV